MMSYYFQNFYEQSYIEKALIMENFQFIEVLKCQPDDVIRREVIRHIRTFFNIEFSFFDKKYPHKFKDYFQKELKI
jgi:coproporphyrinogen III oxidase-like Fe-S oxidoreductase